MTETLFGRAPKAFGAARRGAHGVLAPPLYRLIQGNGMSRAFAVLLFFMADFVFLIFIMAQPHGQMLSM
jgi:hypothetical protein